MPRKNRHSPRADSPGCGKHVPVSQLPDTPVRTIGRKPQNRKSVTASGSQRRFCGECYTYTPHTQPRVNNYGFPVVTCERCNTIHHVQTTTVLTTLL